MRPDQLTLFQYYELISYIAGAIAVVALIAIYLLRYLDKRDIHYINRIKKPTFMTGEELYLYNEISSRLPKGYTLIGQIRVKDIFGNKLKLSDNVLDHEISYLICDKRYKVVAAFELDANNLSSQDIELTRKVCMFFKVNFSSLCYKRIADKNYIEDEFKKLTNITLNGTRPNPNPLNKDLNAAAIKKKQKYRKSDPFSYREKPKEKKVITNF